MVGTLKCFLITFIDIIIELRVRLVGKRTRCPQIIALNACCPGLNISKLDFFPQLASSKFRSPCKVLQ